MQRRSVIRIGTVHGNGWYLAARLRGSSLLTDLAILVAMGCAMASTARVAASELQMLDPRSQTHIPIGIPDTVDTLKTFVEAEGSFSPGCGSYGVYFWVYDAAGRKLTAPTMNGVDCEHGLTDEGYLIPSSAWKAESLPVRTSVCEVRRTSPAGQFFVVGARATLSNPSAGTRRVSMYVALRPLGPAGYAVTRMSVASARDALMVEGHPALGIFALRLHQTAITQFFGQAGRSRIRSPMVCRSISCRPIMPLPPRL